MTVSINTSDKSLVQSLTNPKSTTNIEFVEAPNGKSIFDVNATVFAKMRIRAYELGLNAQKIFSY